jgi:hypothetical protein
VQHFSINLERLLQRQNVFYDYPFMFQGLVIFRPSHIETVLVIEASRGKPTAVREDF